MPLSLYALLPWTGETLPPTQKPMCTLAERYHLASFLLSIPTTYSKSEVILKKKKTVDRRFRFYISISRYNQDGLLLNGTHQLLAYADDVNILEGSVHTVKENAEALVVATKETGLEVNADKTKYMVMFRDRNAGRGH